MNTSCQPAADGAIKSRAARALLVRSALLIAGAALAAPPPPAARAATPATVPAAPVPPFDHARMAAADEAVAAAVAAGQTPGAVLLVGRGDRTGGSVLYCKAYGNRAVAPDVEPMTADTIFDLASLTKPVATATSVMVLVDRGLVRVDRPAADYLPEFGRRGKERVTVAQLLLHTGGLVADNRLADYDDGPAAAWAKICDLPLAGEPGSAFVYSDVGYVVLGKLVERVSGRRLEVFSRQEVFDPLGMSETSFNPPAERRPRTAPTERRDNRWMRGEVHDPRAHALGGVAGHAGLFSTAADLARFCRMILAGGALDGRRVLQSQTVALMTAPRDLPSQPGQAGKPGGTRTYGFDCDTAYSGPRGDRFPRGVSFGHTGFTGTSLWIDPQGDGFVVLLANSVHPDGKGKMLALRKTIGSIAGEALLGASTDRIDSVQPSQTQGATTVPADAPRP